MSGESRGTGHHSGHGSGHGTSVVVWDVPAAVECGEIFRVKVGVKCAAGCDARGWRLEVRDFAGKALAEAAAGQEPWPGTAGLYHAEIELRAPVSEGLYNWEAHLPAVESGAEDEDGGGHAASSAGFRVRAAPRAECLIRVEAVDAESRTPVRGARVVAHPYRCVTDERGLAELRVSKGRYRLFVSGGHYFPYRLDANVDADMTIKAELHADLGPSDAEMWS